MMTVAASRELHNEVLCFVGIGMPSEAANLARATHAPDCVLVYESGTIGARPEVLPHSIGDGELAKHADSVVPIPEIFNYWLQTGRIDVGFLGAAQIDRYANINTTVVGPYEQPKVRLPGAGGAPEIAASAKEVIVMLGHSRRAFVEELAFVTSAGHLEGGGSREKTGYLGAGPTVVITDLGVLRPDPETRELTLVALHPEATVEQAREATGWALHVAEDLAATDAPTERELQTLRGLRERTEAANKQTRVLQNLCARLEATKQ
ncbi:MAG: CoA-transferase subunit beta [Rubrobacteraceae bacterium]